MLNLDTHILLFALAGTVDARERRLLSSAQWGISAIVLWEIAKLSQLKRVDISLDDPEVGRVLRQVHVWPLTREIAMMSTKLDFEGDPADQIIAATRIEHKVPLVTRDRAIRRSKRVPFPT